MTAWLLTWLWQGVALTLGAALLLRVNRLNASTRHLGWWAALIADIWLGYSASPYRGLQPIPVSVKLLTDPNGMQFAAEPYLLVTELSSVFLSVFLGVWAAIAAVKLVRLLPSLHAVYALRDRCRPFPADVESHLPLWLEANKQGRHTELMICDAVAGATVLGFQRPIIAIPSSLLQALSAEDLDQVILHEHAHVQRRDDWARLLQTMLQAVLWIHPAIAFVGRALNREREIACDELVVARTGLPKKYARCLTRAAEVRNRIRVEPLLVPALFGGRHDLVSRVDRLLAIKGRTRAKVSLAAAAATACVVFVMSAQLRAVPLVGASVAAVLPEVATPVARLAASAFAPGNPEELRRDRLYQPAAPHSLAPDASDAFTPVRQSLGRQGFPPPLASSTRALARPAVALAKAGSTAPPSATGVAAGFETAPGSSAPNAPIAPVAPNAPIETLEARSFDASYQPVKPPTTSLTEPTPWGAAATAGVELGNAARNAGVGMAGFFSRAGVSLARRF